MRRFLILAVCVTLAGALNAGCKDSCEKMYDKFTGCMEKMGASKRVMARLKDKEGWLKGCRASERSKKIAAECVKKESCQAFINCFSRRR
jgi:hypothetical protein